jgi:hypothetical protein
MSYKIQVVAIALALGACGGAGSSSGTGSNETDNSTSPVDCSSRCSAIVDACGAPSNVVASACSKLCAAKATAAQLDCLSGQSCSALEMLMKQGTPLCGLGDDGTSGGSNGSGGGSCTPEVNPSSVGCSLECTERYSNGSEIWCTSSCRDSSDCPSGSGVTYACFGGMCLPACASDDDCTSGWWSGPFRSCAVVDGVCQ